MRVHRVGDGQESTSFTTDGLEKFRNSRNSVTHREHHPDIHRCTTLEWKK